MNALEKIISYKKREVSERKSLYPARLLERSVYFQAPVVSLEKYLMRTDRNGIIAEIKRHSPSKGDLNRYVNVEKVSVGYMQAGASALSILTDQEFFKGSSEDLMIARKFNFCPILRKDFIIDEYQIIESRSMGADAILLIASILTKDEVRLLSRLANSLGMEVLLELHDESDLEKVADITIVGVNNRDLKSLKIDIETSYKMSGLIPENHIKVSESGIEDAATIQQLQAHGYKGFLIGSYFMKHPRPEAACKEFILKLNKTKSKNQVYEN